MLRHWGFAVFLLTVPIPILSKTTTNLSTRQRRSVGHAQMMHDRSRILHDRKRRTWIQELLEQVHTAQAWDSANQSEGSVQWARPKHTPSSKHFPLNFDTGAREEQETSKRLGYDKRHLKPVMKRKSKMCLGRWRETDTRRDRGCLFHMRE
ncbi:hypothetical protein DNTS_015910 [Danionella cerebrum]|nr:hypothetical protein DNTS_015910 [Danionella translucida]